MICTQERNNLTFIFNLHTTNQSFDDGELHELPYIYNITTEPTENYPQIIGGKSHSADGADNKDMGKDNNQALIDEHDVHLSMDNKKSYLTKAFKLIKPNHLLSRDEYPAEINHVFELSNVNNEIGCFLWQRSIFYSKAMFGSHAFHLRWFTITPHMIYSSPDRHNSTKHRIVYPRFGEIHADANKLVIHIVHPVEGKHDFTLMAPSKLIFEACLDAFQVYINCNEEFRSHGNFEVEEVDGVEQSKNDNDADEHVTLIECPSNSTRLETILWTSVLPLRYIMHFTLPDIRHLDYHGDMTKSVGYAYLSTITCLIWLILGKCWIINTYAHCNPAHKTISHTICDMVQLKPSGSYTMVTSLESLAEQIGISTAIMGVTLSAAGTSLPAFIASRIAAEKGFGNQAVANVFGSNTFNISVGLGLPWVIYIAVNGLEPYQDLPNECIMESILILAGTLILFVALMVLSDCVLQKWHADLFVLLYVVYIFYAVLS